jgi:hypothetical protein
MVPVPRSALLPVEIDNYEGEVHGEVRQTADDRENKNHALILNVH